MHCIRWTCEEERFAVKLSAPESWAVSRCVTATSLSTPGTQRQDKEAHVSTKAFVSLLIVKLKETRAYLCNSDAAGGLGLLLREKRLQPVVLLLVALFPLFTLVELGH